MIGVGYNPSQTSATNFFLPQAKLRGQVATEQEKVLTAKESELEEVQTALQDLRGRLQAEEGRREQGEIQIGRLQASLEEAKKTIGNNENSKLCNCHFFVL